MCGIVAAIARKAARKNQNQTTQNVVPVLIEGLQRLEYRGYDSTGLAAYNQAGLHVYKSLDRVADLATQTQQLCASIGIAHTRWATHGAPALRNAHPHLSSLNQVELSLVHNGIIENHDAFRASLIQSGYAFESDTDTEVMLHLIHQTHAAGTGLRQAVQQVCAQLHGLYAIAVFSKQNPNLIVGTRRGAPLLIGIGEHGYYLASDTSALLSQTKQFIYLEQGDTVCLTPETYEVFDLNGNLVSRPIQISEQSVNALDKGEYQHFMQKEIFEQPAVIAETLSLVQGAQSLGAFLFGSQAEEHFKHVERVLILACGTSFHAACVAKYWLEAIAKIPTQVEIASEYRYRQSVAQTNTLIIAISQSGETADTLAALEHADQEHANLAHCVTLAICNVPESSLMRRSRLKFLTRAGPEIGVASTKAFTTQLVALYTLALVLAKTNQQLNKAEEDSALQALRHLPQVLQETLATEEQIKTWVPFFVDKQHALFLGRGIHYPIALEGALKLKEISYIHAEGYAAGELKHGPLALVDHAMPVVAVAPNDALIEKLKSNLQEVRARGGKLFVFADHDVTIETAPDVKVIQIAKTTAWLSPIVHVIPLQLLSYHVATARGTDVDKPRNLAKSVTVE
jgi:glucosamine--fructose-6-phosphate aminotransferase (isomerizing)